MSDELSLIPESLAREFVPERALARGAFGAVFRARQRGLDRPVALKLLLSADTDPEQLKRFDREARVTAALNHPGIVRLYAHGVAGDTPWIAYELVEGGSVRDLVAQGPLPLADALDIARQIADGLACAHSAGILHRDVKPDNVLLAEDGACRIADFGVARRSLDRSWHTAPGTVLGTPYYLSPEAIRGAPTAACDVYALAIMLHEMLAGAPPCPASEPLAVLQWHLAPERPRLARVPAAVAGFVHRAIACDAATRFDSAAAFAQALAEVPVPASPRAGASRASPAAQPRRATVRTAVTTPSARTAVATSPARTAVTAAPARPPLAAALGGLVALGLAAGLAYAIFGNPPPPAQWRATPRVAAYPPAPDFPEPAGALTATADRETAIRKLVGTKRARENTGLMFSLVCEMEAQHRRGDRLDDYALVQLLRLLGLAFAWDRDPGRDDRTGAYQVPPALALPWYEDALAEYLARVADGRRASRDKLGGVAQTLNDLASGAAAAPDPTLCLDAFSKNLAALLAGSDPRVATVLRDSWREGHHDRTPVPPGPARDAMRELSASWGFELAIPWWVTPRKE